VLPLVSHFEYMSSGVASAWPIIVKRTSSTKPEVHNVLRCFQRTEARPRLTYTENFVRMRFGLWFLRYASGPTYRQTYIHRYTLIAIFTSTGGEVQVVVVVVVAAAVVVAVSVAVAVVVMLRSGQSLIGQKRRIPTAQGRFSDIRQVAPVCTQPNACFLGPPRGQTDRQTDRPRFSVCNNRPHLCT